MLHMPGPLVMKDTAMSSAATCARVCSCECTPSHVHVHSPALRKSKIGVSLNSFPLAAQTAFVLQTKRKRNETEGSEEAGRRRERGSPGHGANRGSGKQEGKAGRGEGEKAQDGKLQEHSRT